MTDLKKPVDNQDAHKRRNKTFVQIIWGVALVLAGTAVFFRIPQVMPRIEKIGQFSSAMVYIRFCLYLFGNSFGPRFININNPHQFNVIHPGIFFSMKLPKVSDPNHTYS